MNLTDFGDQLICASCRYVTSAGIISPIEGVTYVFLYSTRIAIQVPRLNNRAILLTNITVEQLRLYTRAEQFGLHRIEALNFIPQERELTQNNPVNQNIRVMEEEQIEAEPVVENITNEVAPPEVQPQFLNPNAEGFIPNRARENPAPNEQNILAAAYQETFGEMDLSYFDRFDVNARDIPHSPPPPYEELEQHPIPSNGDNNLIINPINESGVPNIDDNSSSSDDSSSSSDDGSSSDDDSSSSDDDSSSSDDSTSNRSLINK